MSRNGVRPLEESDRDRQVQWVIVMEGLANLVILIIKLIVGFMTGSLAIIADAVHSFSDLANNIVVWFVIRLSAEPPDRKHPYGHRKFETVAVFALAVLLFVVAIEVVLRAFQRGEPNVAQSTTGVVLMLAVLGTNIAIAGWESNRAKALKSDILHADASHTFSDVLTTVVVIVGWQLSVFGFPWVDTVCAFAVAVLIGYLAFGLLKKVLPVLVDEYAIEPGALASNAMTVPGVEAVRQVRSRYLGSGVAVDMVLTVDPSISATEAHDISEVVEKLIGDCFQVDDISIHIEPHKEQAPDDR
ncbi:MAG: cation diffusion facilitator family transporter [Gammaproteobacteria bacterium]